MTGIRSTNSMGRTCTGLNNNNDWQSVEDAEVGRSTKVRSGGGEEEAMVELRRTHS